MGEGKGKINSGRDDSVDDSDRVWAGNIGRHFWIYDIYGIYMLYIWSIYCTYEMGCDVQMEGGTSSAAAIASLPPGNCAVAAVRHLECRLLCVARAQL